MTKASVCSGAPKLIIKFNGLKFSESGHAPQSPLTVLHITVLYVVAAILAGPAIQARIRYLHLSPFSECFPAVCSIAISY